MVKKQQLAVDGGLTCVLSSSSRSVNKQQDSAAAAAATGKVLPWHPSSSFYSTWRQWQWQWTSCVMHPRTLSFRQLEQQQKQQPAEQEEEEAKNGHGRHHQKQQHDEEAAYYKTVNSVCSGDSSFASVDSSASTASEEAESDAEAVILQALRSDRLLYDEPAPAADDLEDDDASCCRLIKQQQSINMQKQAAKDGDDKVHLGTNSKALHSATTTTASTAALAFGGATAMSVESHNPYRDFRESMEAMVMSQLRQEGGVKDWRWLEEMLGWYLKANGKSTHGLIVAAFVDLLVDAADYNYSSSSSSSSSPVATPPSSASATNCSAVSSIHSIDDCSCCSPSSL